jgi:hypothetical protein
MHVCVCLPAFVAKAPAEPEPSHGYNVLITCLALIREVSVFDLAFVAEYHCREGDPSTLAYK